MAESSSHDPSPILLLIAILNLCESGKESCLTSSGFSGICLLGVGLGVRGWHDGGIIGWLTTVGVKGGDTYS